MKKIGIELSDELYKQAKIKAIQQDQTLRNYVTNLIKKDLETKKDIHM